MLGRALLVWGLARSYGGVLGLFPRQLLSSAGQCLLPILFNFLPLLLCKGQRHCNKEGLTAETSTFTWKVGKSMAWCLPNSLFPTCPSETLQ